MRPKMPKMRPKMSKMRPEMAKMRPKMAKMRPEMYVSYEHVMEVIWHTKIASSYCDFIAI